MQPARRPNEGGERVRLSHRGFIALGDIVFERSPTDDMPMVVVPLGGRPAALPLRALQRELAIPDESEDGRMVGLICQALDFVAGLRPGDRLPAEVLTGEASWEPLPHHVAAVRARLLAELRAHGRPDRIDPPDAAVPTPAEILAGVAAEIGARDAAEADTMVDSLSHELAYIELLNEQLLAPIGHMARMLGGLRLRGSVGTYREAVTQARRLSAVALQNLGGRFAEVAAQCGEVVSTLRNLEAQKTYIRSHRDWLQRTRLAWASLLQEWDELHPDQIDRAQDLVVRTYRFLAPRFMAVQEWRSVGTKSLPAKRDSAVMHW